MRFTSLLNLKVTARGLFAFFYGVVCYIAGTAALLYFVGFSSNLFVPVSVDVGRSAPVVEAVITNLLLLIFFGLQHSVMARQGFKRWWTRLVPVAVERSTYLVATCAALALIFFFWIPIEKPVVWQVDHPAIRTLLWSGFWLGWLLVVVSSFLINHFELFGLQQVFARLTGRAISELQFRTPFIYRYVRHPLYAGMMLAFWSVPIMSVGRLLFAVGFSVYILIGIAFEERDLVRQFGDRYRAYRRRVGMLLPYKSSEVLAPNTTAMAHDPFDDGRALQDRLQVHCFGCGTLNVHGLHIKSRWEGDEFVCIWQPLPEHIGFPGFVYGGTIASVMDCHAIWASLSLHCRNVGHDLNSGPPPFAVVTGRLSVNYLKSARVEQALELRARIVTHDDRKCVVVCSVHQGSVECATGEVVTVRVKGVG